MRKPTELVHSRARRTQTYAVFPIEGYPTSRIPAWRETEIRVLSSPAIGAGFVQYMMHVQPGGGTRQTSDGRTQSFLYVLAGNAALTIDGTAHPLTPGSFALVPAASDFDLRATEDCQLLLLRKVYEPAADIPAPAALVGHESKVPADPWMENPHSRLQVLIPDELPYDFAMNIFTFDPGYGLPYVETHVMEHGLYFLAGKGLYYLDGTWMEVEATDFIYMGPYCPQSFYTTGPGAAKYIYYKNVNREIPL